MGKTELNIDSFRKLINSNKYENSNQSQKIFDKNTSYLYANSLISLSNTQNTLQNKIFVYILMFRKYTRSRQFSCLLCMQQLQTPKVVSKLSVLLP